MSIYKPTWLYIKQHNQTGLKYFGKHSGSDPTKYIGSGVYWRRHLSTHGNDVSTIWCQLFENKQSLIEYASRFSEKNNIVKSNEWANLKPESGLDGSGNIIQHWYNNGVENKLLPPESAGDWMLGRINQKTAHTGGHLYNNGEDSVIATESPGTNWTLGMLPSQKRAGFKMPEKTSKQLLRMSAAQRKNAIQYSLIHKSHGSFVGSFRDLAEKYPEQKLLVCELWKMWKGTNYKINGYKGWKIQ